MSAPLPERLDPRRAVLAGDRYRGELPLAALPRLAALLEPAPTDGSDPRPAPLRSNPQPQSGAAGAGQVTYDLAFERDGAGRATVTGRVQALLPLRCERCAEPMLLPVDAELLLALVEGLDEAAALPETYDPLLLAPGLDGRSDGRSDTGPDSRLIAPRDLIEDELILAIPVVVRHPDGECPVDWSVLVSIAAGSDATGATADLANDPADDATPARPNPFAVLAAMKAREPDS